MIMAGRVTGYDYLGEDEENIKAAVYARGAVAVAFNARGAAFQNYKKGVYTGPCNTTDPNHALTIIGYGVEKKTRLKYWIVKNSWGSTWGQSGYFWLERGVNRCGVADFAYVPKTG